MAVDVELSVVYSLYGTNACAVDVNNALLAKLNSPVTRFFQLLTEAGWRKSVNTAGKNSLKSVQLSSFKVVC